MKRDRRCTSVQLLVVGWVLVIGWGGAAPLGRGSLVLYLCAPMQVGRQAVTPQARMRGGVAEMSCEGMIG